MRTVGILMIVAGVLGIVYTVRQPPGVSGSNASSGGGGAPNPPNP